MDTITGSRVFIHPNECADSISAVYIRLPLSLQNPIVGGCDCRHCKAGALPTWDTLLIPLTGHAVNTVHCPDLESAFTLLPANDQSFAVR